jgi:hypothetical protein
VTHDKTKTVPPPRFNEKGNSIYPFPKMDVGESVLFELGDKDSAKTAVAIRARQCAYQYARRHGKKFVARSSSEGMRIWRTA